MMRTKRWETYLHEGYEAAAQVKAKTADDCFYLALLAWSEQRIAEAVHYTHQATSLAPAQLVYTQAAAYLARVVASGTAHVYATGEGFAAFIRGGSNVPLYTATSTALRELYERRAGLRVLDIGTGDGHALLPALGDAVLQLDVLEPSPALYTTLCERLSSRGIAFRGHPVTLQKFVGRTEERWDVAQATYSLQSIAPNERTPLLRWLHEHVDRLVIAEFDVPAFSAPCAPDHVAYAVEHYQRGLAEYPDDLALVGQQFLMPVFFGYFDATRARTNYEQPIAAWADELRRAGFQSVQTRPLFPYWWATAYWVEATARS